MGYWPCRRILRRMQTSCANPRLCGATEWPARALNTARRRSNRNEATVDSPASHQAIHSNPWSRRGCCRRCNADWLYQLPSCPQFNLNPPTALACRHTPGRFFRRTSGLSYRRRFQGARNTGEKRSPSDSLVESQRARRLHARRRNWLLCVSRPKI